MSPITPSFTPGDRYFDHFDLVTLEHPDFYPDGRDLGENYTMTGWHMNPCAKSGQLECLHCHTSSGRYRFSDPSRANDACLPCHQERVENAPAHTHHKVGSEGNRCVSCHMPTTEFARMRRSDHSMLPPTPATTLAYKSPNACGNCHTNSPAWADQQVRSWHKHDYQKPVLERAALIDAARKSDWRKLPEILAYLQNTNRAEIQSASLVRLLENCQDERKYPVLRALIGAPPETSKSVHSGDPSPLVRASAAEALGTRLDSENLAALLRAADDEFRLVRVRAAAALAPVPDQMFQAAQKRSVAAAMNEHIAALKARPDDPTSHYNLGNFLLARGQHKTAIDSFAFASKLEPHMIAPYVNASLAYNAIGDNLSAETSLRKALALEGTNAAVHLNLGMLLAELGKPAVAEEHFRSAFRSDPRSAQAAYNLAVLVSQTNPSEAIGWAGKAANLNPDEPKYAYTYAYFLARTGHSSQAVEVLRAALVRHPAERQMRDLLNQLQR
jgi:tetratricopeptide (TPR) repeat protein